MTDLRSHAASAKSLEELKADLSRTLAELEEKSAIIDETKEHLATVSDSILRQAEFTNTHYQTKEAAASELQFLRNSQIEVRKQLYEASRAMEENYATKQDMKAFGDATEGSLSKLKGDLAAASSDLQKTMQTLQNLEEHCRDKLATKEFAVEEASKTAREVAAASDASQEIGQLKREFEEERERLRQNVRQQQHTRKDLNGTIEEVHALRVKCGDLEKSCSQLGEREDGLETREAEHFREGQLAVAKRQQKQEDLEFAIKQLREEFIADVEFQRGEREKLLQNSTQHYLEQLDKALHLHKGLQQVQTGQDELAQKFATIKLPPVKQA
jgi:chromosome segregation ATPase